MDGALDLKSSITVEFGECLSEGDIQVTQNRLSLEEAWKEVDESLRQKEWFKYVRLASGEFRFVTILSGFSQMTIVT